MARSRMGRSDVVIGMTLAEVFLLLLIVGWYGSRLESEEKVAAGGTPATVSKSKFDESERLRHEAETKLADSKRQYEQLERILDWIAKTAGLAKPIQSLDEAKQAIDTIKADARRGRPACNPENVLVDVVADSGGVTAKLKQSLSIGGIDYLPGQRLSDSHDIAAFLRHVDAWYVRQTSGRSGCVYDFTLSWRTDQDYRSAREMFEQHFYPAGIRRIK